MTKVKINKKVTLESLLEAKCDIDNSKVKEYHSEQLSGIIEFVRINPEKASDLIASMNNKEISEFSMYQQLIYLSCPLFQNKDLIKKHNVAEPFEVVYKVLNNSLAEIYDIGNLLLKWYGFDIDVKK